ncbi:MAG: LptF/LptG family permease [Candidatus Eremiobacteraeota bacterium]|nr:LptF/LptG family permease [Candidatus Eremiobacteraeota bacterium]
MTGAAASPVAQARGLIAAFARPRILDRYMIAEFVGPFAFGLSAFTLIYAATDLLAISRLVSEQHAPLFAAVGYFLWQLPMIVITVAPIAMLFGMLLALQRLSSESEITALKAGGIGLVRTVAPLLVLGVFVSIVVFALQEGLVPFANDQGVALREDAIKRVGAFGGGSHTVVSELPEGGQQITYFRGYEPATQALLYVTIVTYGADKRPQAILFSDRGHYESPSWTFQNASIYRFASDGSLTATSQDPRARIDIGEKPTELQERATDNNRETMSRSQIREIIASGQLSPQETRNYQTSYEEKLARPFACFVFTLIAAPFGLRPTRGGGTGFGFALSLGIAFLYFVIASISSAVCNNLPGGYATSTIGAWLPNVLFTAIGAAFLLRAARK